MEINEQHWFTLHGHRVEDMLGSIGQLVHEGYEVHIGTDAQKASRFSPAYQAPILQTVRRWPFQSRAEGKGSTSVA